MKLLPKTKVSALKSDERLLAVQEGAKLAKTVDALRQAKATEEANLAKFRTESLKEVQRQISEKVEELKAIDAQIVSLRDERIRLEAPIELTQKWEEVNKLKQDLIDRESYIISREVLLKDVEFKSVEADKREADSKKLFDEAHKTYTKVDDLRNEMESRKKESDTIIDDKLESLNLKEKDIVNRETIVSQQLAHIESEKKEILNSNVLIIERESSVDSRSKDLDSREFSVKEMENLTKRLNDEAVFNHNASEELKTQKEEEKKKSDKEIKTRYEELSKKEQEIGYKERDLVLARQSVEHDRKEIEKERAHIASQQQTLRATWENIRKLQANK